MNLSFLLAACPCNPSGGYCDEYGRCICYQGYTGQYCEELACPCNSSGGYCDGFGGCYCYPRYTGQYCDEIGREKHADRRVGGKHMWVRFGYSDRYGCETKWQHWSMSIHEKAQTLQLPPTLRGSDCHWISPHIHIYIWLESIGALCHGWEGKEGYTHEKKNAATVLHQCVHVYQMSPST